MTLEEVTALIERQAHAWRVGNIEIALADFAPDALFQSPGGQWIGHEQIRTIANNFFAGATEVKVTITRIIFDGQYGAVEWTWEETVRASGRRRLAEDAILFDIVDGKITRWREYFDPAQMERPVEDA